MPALPPLSRCTLVSTDMMKTFHLMSVLEEKKNILPEAGHEIKEGAREKNFHKYKKGNLGALCSSARVIKDY